jgi:hypothetical protein
MTTRSLSFLFGLLLVSVVLATPAAAKKKPPLPPPPPPPPPTSTSSTYVRSYADVLGGVRCAVTPEAVQATADGGSIALTHADCRGVSWLAKFDAAGNPQWQTEVGCFNIAPGGYALGLAVQQTHDGGYVVGGGTRDCDFSPICAYLTSQACGLVQKLDASGNLVWSRVYSSSARDTTIEDVRQTNDGGFVAVGTFIDENGDIGSVVLKLNGTGVVEWQTLLGPSGRTHALLNAVQPTAEGYVAAGRFYTASSDLRYSVLVVKLDANGNLQWQRGFNNFDGSGNPVAGENVESIIATLDGGYLVAGSWGNPTLSSPYRQGPLLLKLDANGNSVWQKAYSAGVHCSSYIGTRCDAIGGLAYSVNQVADGGFAFAGAGHLTLAYGAQLVPSLTRTDASGNLQWQHFYYESYPSTGAAISQYFASSSVTRDGGHLAVGFTENPVDSKGELFAVRTDNAGLVGACSAIHPATPVTVVDPGLASVDPGFPVRTTAPLQADLPGKTQSTSISSRGGQC